MRSSHLDYAGSFTVQPPGTSKVYVRWYRDNHVSPQQTEVAIELLQQFLGTLLMMDATIMEVH